MVKKKVAKKKTIRKVVKKKTSNKKFNLVLNKFILFLILFIISFVVYFVSTKPLIEDIFSLLTIIFGSVALGFLIILLTFLFMRFLKK